MPVHPSAGSHGPDWHFEAVGVHPRPLTCSHHPSTHPLPGAHIHPFLASWQVVHSIVCGLMPRPSYILIHVTACAWRGGCSYCFPYPSSRLLLIGHQPHFFAPLLRSQTQMQRKQTGVWCTTCLKHIWHAHTCLARTSGSATTVPRTPHQQIARVIV